MEFFLCESLTYRYPSPANPAYLIRAAPEVAVVVNADADVSSGILYQHEPLEYGMEGSVPLDWKRMTVRTAKVRCASGAAMLLSSGASSFAR